MLTPKELTKLAQQLAQVGPGWTLLVGSELVSALRLGTRRYEAVGTDAEHLLAEVVAAEDRIAENLARVKRSSPLVQNGLASTVSHVAKRAS